MTLDAQRAVRAIARILDESGTTVGLGAIVLPDIILTCRHVVEDALAIDAGGGSTARGLAVKFDVPFEPTPPRTGVADVAVVIDDGATGSQPDFAVLRIRKSPLTVDAHLAPKLTRGGLWQRRFAAFGCPAGHDDGIWTTGIVLGPTASGLIAIQAENTVGYQIEHGFSGGPVFDVADNTILGIVVSKEISRSVRGGFMLPVEAMVSLWPPLRRRATLRREASPGAKGEAAGTHITMFFYSPPNTARENSIVENVVAKINGDPFIRGRGGIDLITWTDDFTNDSQQSLYTEQEAKARGLKHPGDCDVVLVALWNHPGPVVNNSDVEGESAVEWILRKAADGNAPSIAILHRQEHTLLDADDPEILSHLQAVNAAKRIAAEAQRTWPGAKIFRYDDFTAVEPSLEHYLRSFLAPAFRESMPDKPRDQVTHHDSIHQANTPVWPYPGLKTFGRAERSVFFGRRLETERIFRHLQDKTGVPITLVGPSGSGKSSLVNAGVLPQLDLDAIPGSSAWPYMRYTPAEVSDDPLVALAYRLHGLIGPDDVSPRTVLERIRGHDDGILWAVEKVVQDRPRGSRLVMVVDQFEELLTLASPEHVESFTRNLAAAATHDRVALILCIRADFVGSCLGDPRLATIMQAGIQSLGVLDRQALSEIIELPATYAGIEFEAGLDELVLQDVVGAGGSLPLLAFAMAELGPLCIAKGVITYEAYESIGGVKGALARYSSARLNEIGIGETELRPIFSNFVEVQQAGTAVRKRFFPGRLKGVDDLLPTVEHLVASRLVTAAATTRREPYFELSHESLMEHWPALSHWLAQERGSRSRSLRRSAEQYGEMSRRRALAVERSTAGRVFLPTWGPYDGRYAWVVVDPELYERYLRGAKWREGRAPGLITQKIRVGAKEPFPVIFRLRGCTPSELAVQVRTQGRLIGEFWPNKIEEGFRGINFVRPTATGERQDLVPLSQHTYILGIADGLLILR